MAWIESEKKFLNRKERQERINLFEKYIEKVKNDHSIDELSELSDELLIEVGPIAQELKRLKRVHRAETDLLYFSWEYFSEAGNPDNQGNWDGFDLKRPEEAAEFHNEICSIMDHVSNVETNSKTCVAAPRGHAKSTYLSRSFPLRELCFRKRTYIVAISLDLGLTQGNLEWLAMQLKYNKKLREDFGPILSKKKQENPKDNMEEFITWCKDASGETVFLSRCEAVTSGQPLRGRNWNGVRPDLIICDDLEDLEKNAGTPEQRKKVKNWYNSVVEFLGDPKGKKTATVYMGTTVHHDCLLIDLLYNRADYKTKIYRAIIDPPERLDLWAECEQIYKNPDEKKEDRVKKAHEFYLENKDEMEKGSRVLWPESKSLWDLYQIKWERSSYSFSTEYMNNPVDEESQIFKVDDFHFYDPSLFDFRDVKYDIYFGCDFAMGKKERGDFSALTVLAKNRSTGTVYVVESHIEKLHPDKFMNLIVDRTIHWQPEKIAADAIATQEFMADVLTERLRNVGYPSYTRLKKFKDRQRKEHRIEALLPDVKDGKIQFNKRHHRLIEQFEQIGTNAHDDGPDSLQMGYSVAKTGNVEIVDKPWWM